MSNLNVFPVEKAKPWKPVQIFLIRFAAIYFLLHIFPFYPSYIRDALSADWSKLAIFDIVKLSGLYPQFIDPKNLPQFGLPSYTNLFIAAGISLIGAFAWSIVQPHRSQYNSLYYWLRTVVRFRLAFTVIVYGLIKVFPLHFPFPSLSNLVSYYGDHLPWKIYWNSLGVIPWYEVFFGACEIIMGLLLFFRQTVTFGSGIIVGFFGNVYASNIS